MKSATQKDNVLQLSTHEWVDKRRLLEEAQRMKLEERIFTGMERTCFPESK